jgi:FlaA1/EpsC-like NDP-sugar epimerase
VEITDLLRRAPIARTEDLCRYLTGCTVLVTGAGGSIGRELCRQVAYASPRRLILLGHGENSIFEAGVELAERFPSLEVRRVVADVREPVRMRQVFDTYQPDVVFHAAAHKHVPLMEENPEEAITNNVEGTMHVLDAAVACGTQRLVLISTDKAVSPSSVMGASKRVAEMLVHQAGMRTGRALVVVRFGNVLGSRGSVVPEFRRQIERGGPVIVTHPDMKRFFMTIPEAVHLVLQAGGMGRGGELFVLNMGEQVKIVDLAVDLIKLSGYSPGQIPIRFSGIRPGEKLEEALWERGARVEATSHPDILRVCEARNASDDLELHVAAMVRAARAGDRQAMLASFAECVPGFQLQGQEGAVPSGTVEPGGPVLSAAVDVD